MDQNAVNIREALETIALEYSRGNCSIDLLVKACDSYKIKTGFDDGLDYQILVAKSCYDHVNGVVSSEEILKAIVPGTTKVIDGIMYVYSPTAPGSQQPYDWHVVRKVARGKTLDDSQVSKKQNYVNQLFPQDLSSLKIVGAAGGSTGAKIVEDVNGNRYIMKRGDASGNTNNGHIQNEYLANQMYDMLGLRVPDFELYDDNGTAVLLSRFIPGCSTPVPSKDYKAMAQGFIADTVLANWDVYQNDNCLIDYAGRVVRVDNGGSLEYRAQGKKKTYDDDVLNSFLGMIKHNQIVYNYLKPSDILNQINELQKKKQDVVDYLKQSGNTVLADIVGKRIDNLKDIVKYLQNQKAISEIPILPRKLKSHKDMYRALTADELKKIYDANPGSNGYGKLMNTGKNGWELLSQVCQLRGFDARPQVVTEDEYWKLVAAAPERQFYRGLDKNYVNADTAVKSLLFDDECFYGTQAAYGEGIYAHRNDTNGKINKVDKSNYRNESAWEHAREYSGTGGAIVKGLIKDDAKIVKFDDIKNELTRFTPGAQDPSEVKRIQGEIAKIDAQLVSIQKQIDDFDVNLKSAVFAKMKFDESSAADMSQTIDDVDWGKIDAFGEREIPSFDEFVVGKMGTWVKEQGGTVKVDKGAATFELPNSSEKCVVNVYQYNGPFSILRKNPFAPAYNAAVQRFVNWMETEHISKAWTALKEERDSSGDKMDSLKQQKANKEAERRGKEAELADSTNANDSTMLGAIYKNKGYRQVLGLFAAIKGYDAIEVTNGNGRKNSFYVILNRSKLIVSNTVDYT